MIEIGEWTPDQPAIKAGAADALNVIPLEGTYGPLSAVSEFSGALSARCLGAISVRDSAGARALFAGDTTKLYKLSGTTFGDVSRSSGGAYAVPSDGSWQFAEFGSNMIAVNGVDAPQTIDIASGTNFAALGGSPPAAAFVRTMRDFVVMGRASGYPQRIQWSGINNSATWGSSASTQADYQDLPDGGWINGLAGGEYGLIFQASAIRRMTYEGPPTIHRIDKIADGVGAAIPGCVAQWGDRAWCVHDSGFFEIQGGAQIVPIGHGKIDRWFWSDIDPTTTYKTSAAVDPVNMLYVLAYASRAGGGQVDSLLIYNWSMKRWSRARVTVDLVFSGLSSSTAYTLEDLDAFGTLETLPFSLDSAVWSGRTRLLLGAFTTAYKLGFFDGAALAATIETKEFQPVAGRRSFVRSVRPIIEGAGAITVVMGARDRTNDAVVYGGAVAQASHGLAPVRSGGRYHRAKINVAAGGDWTHLSGVDDVQFSAGGSR